MNEEKDYLQERVTHDIDHEPGFAEAWAPYALMSRLVGERLRLGLSQRDLAARMNVSQPAVARMENSPEGVSLARVFGYANAIGVEIVTKPSKEKPKKAAPSRGRSVAGRTKAVA